MQKQVSYGSQRLSQLLQGEIGRVQPSLPGGQPTLVHPWQVMPKEKVPPAAFPSSSPDRLRSVSRFSFSFFRFIVAS
ncbi:MAG: hypothetical protein D6696_12175 [Acidobacteria bacterium]|nr:MAG: hypothetical protein D6696_12175 [Acidobacteriota bacterium]